jgi:hypothetical protein
MSVDEFVRSGYLQEVNRLMLHRCGLALEVIRDDDGMRLGGIWDCRDDPEGIAFDPAPDALKAQFVAQVMGDRALAREALFNGPSVQPVGDES